MISLEKSNKEAYARVKLESRHELVELADGVIVDRMVSRAPSMLLHEVLSRTRITEALILPGTRQILSAAEIFDAFAYPNAEAVRNHLEQYFEVVALPRSRLVSELHPGDLMLRRAEGGLGHLAILTTGETFSQEGMPAQGVILESARSGRYAEVIEAGILPHDTDDHFARRLSDDNGWLSHDSLILRIRESDGTPHLHLSRSAESDTAEAAPSVLFHLFQEWHAQAPVHSSYRGPTTDDRRIVENRATGGGLIAKSRLHLCFLEKAVATLSIDVGSDVVHARWEIIDASGTVVREHPQFTAANHAAGAAAARLVTGQHAWLWDARNSAAHAVFVPAGQYRSRVTITPRGGASTTHETAIEVEGSPYEIQISGEPKTDAELATLFTGIRLLDTHGERIARDCWILVHRGTTDAGHTVFLGQGTIEATIAEGTSRFGAIATPHATPFKAWIRPDPHGDQARPDRIQIESLGRTDGHIDLTNPSGPAPVNPFTDELPHGPFKDGVQAHAGNVSGVTTNGMSIGCTTASALTGTCTAPSSVRGGVRSINSSFGGWGSGTGSERVWVRGPSFVNKQNKRTTSSDALVADDHAAPLLNPLAPTGCGAAHDEPLHMQRTMQQAVFGGYLGHEIPRSAAVSDAPVDQLRIRMELGGYAQGSIYHLYHHALAFGHEAEAAGAGIRLTIWVPRKVIRGWNGNRRNVRVPGFCHVSWTIEHLAPGAAGATTVANLIGGAALGSFVALPELGRLRRTWTPASPLAAGTYTSVFRYQLDLRPFVAGDDAWLAESGGADLLSGQGAILAAETLRTVGARQFVDGANRLQLHP